MKILKIIGNIIIFIGLLLITTVVILGCFAEQQYRVKFDADNGSAITTVYVAENTAVTEPEDPTKNGYTFNYWANGDSSYDFTTLVNENIDLKANYTADKYTVNFNSNGGSTLTSETIEVTFGESYTFETPSKIGFAFVGWFDTDDTEYKSGEWNTVLTDELNLVAKWATTYAVSYVLDGGANSVNNPTHFVVGQTYILEDATKEGFTFVGWYTESTFTNEITTLENINSDTILYAKFTESVVAPNVFDVTYNLNGGTNANNPTTFTEGTTVELQDATKEGFTFDGWYTDAEFTTIITELNDTTVTSNITLHAKFTENVVVPTTLEITYNLNGGTNASNPTTFTQGTTVSLIDPTKEGFTFNGWYTDASFTTIITELNDTTVTSNITLHAKFTENVVVPTTFEIEYNLNGGINGANHTTFTQGTTVSLIDPTKEGFTFNGWYTDASFTTVITELNDTTVTSNITLHAKFTENPSTFEITYNLNGGINGANPATFTQGTTASLIDATQEGFTFVGWYTDASFTTVITELNNTTVTSNITLYAYFLEGIYDADLNKYELNTSTNTLTLIEGSTTATNVTVPQTVAGYTVTSIANRAFDTNATITSIVIASTVTSIGNYAFNECTSLSSVTFEGGSTLETIGASAFYLCAQLLTISLPASLQSFGSAAFANGNASNLTIYVNCNEADKPTGDFPGAATVIYLDS